MGDFPPSPIPSPIMGNRAYSGLWTPAMFGMPIACWLKQSPVYIIFHKFFKIYYIFLYVCIYIYIYIYTYMICYIVYIT